MRRIDEEVLADRARDLQLNGLNGLKLVFVELVPAEKIQEAYREAQAEPEPEIEKKGTLASPATALARSVLPVPGGPTSSTPFGMRPLRALPGSFDS